MSNSTPQKGQASSPDSSPAAGTTEAPNLPSGTVIFLFTDIEGNVVAAQGDHVLANSLLEESLTLLQELGNKGEIANPLEGFAGLAVAKGQAERAARLFGATEALRKATHNPLPPHKHRHYESNVAAARTTLSEKAFEVAWVEGGAMTLEQAVAYALSEEEKR